MYSGLDAIRHVNADCESFLSYAPVDSCAFVLYIKVPKDQINYRNAQAYASNLIDQTIDMGGKYYLPYQLLGSKLQFHAVYPQIKQFVELKKYYDQKELFSNLLYAKYV